MSSPSHPATPLATAAARYCAWLEALPTRRATDTDRSFATREARQMRDLFAELYARGLELSQLTVQALDLDDQPAPRRWTHSDLPNAAARLRACPFSYYRDVYDGHRLDLEGTTSVGDLCDDALDVWVELRGPLELWHAGRHDAAAWSWQVSFEAEVGPHLVHALHALHDFLTDGGS